MLSKETYISPDALVSFGVSTIARTPIGNLRAEYDALKLRIKDYEQKYVEKAREKPVEMAAVAFGVGILAGALLAYMTRRK